MLIVILIFCCAAYVFGRMSAELMRLISNSKKIIR